MTLSSFVSDYFCVLLQWKKAAEYLQDFTECWSTNTSISYNTFLEDTCICEWVYMQLYQAIPEYRRVVVSHTASAQTGFNLLPPNCPHCTFLLSLFICMDSYFDAKSSGASPVWPSESLSAPSSSSSPTILKGKDKVAIRTRNKMRIDTGEQGEMSKSFR